MDTETDYSYPEIHAPAWMNAAVTFGLKTPGLQSLLGRQLGLITFTGRKSRRRINTPVTYFRDGDEVLILTKTARQWWRNFATQPGVTLRLAGKTYSGKAEAIFDNTTKLPLVERFLQNRPRDAKAYGVELGPNNEVDEKSLRALVPHVIPIVVQLD